MKQTHTHKYYRIKTGKTKQTIVYACALPDCYHFVRKEFFLNKKTICWRCENEVFVNKRMLRLAKPTCCTRTNAYANSLPELNDMFYLDEEEPNEED